MKMMMAALAIVICFAIQVSSASQQGEDTSHKVISNTLSNKGYAAVSLILEETLLKYMTPLSSSHQYLTIFVPQDKAFFALKCGEPPITLFKYQIAPLKISDSNHYSPFKVESLIPGHPFVLTALPGAIHGVADNFDPPATLT